MGWWCVCDVGRACVACMVREPALLERFVRSSAVSVSDGRGGLSGPLERLVAGVVGGVERGIGVDAGAGELARQPADGEHGSMGFLFSAKLCRDPVRCSGWMGKMVIVMKAIGPPGVQPSRSTCSIPRLSWTDFSNGEVQSCGLTSVPNAAVD